MRRALSASRNRASKGASGPEAQLRRYQLGGILLSQGVREAEVRSTLDAETRALAGLPAVSDEVLRVGLRWARLVMREAATVEGLLCRPDAAFDLALACSRARPWPQASEGLLRAYPRAQPQQACAVVAEFETRSLVPEADLQLFSPEVLARCASARARARTPAGAARAEAEAPPVGPGLQLAPEVQGTLRSIGVAVGVEYATERWGVGLTPAFSFAELTSGPVAVPSLLLTGRVWFLERHPGGLSPYVQGGVGIAANFNAGPTVAFALGALGVGAEALLTEHLGVTAGLGVQLSVPVGMWGTTVDLVGSLGLVLR